MKEKEEGSFIIRSGRDPSYYVLTHIKNNHVNHTKISKSEMSLEQLMKQCYDMTSISPDEEIIQPLKEEENVGTLYSIFDEHDIKTQLRRKPTFRSSKISFISKKKIVLTVFFKQRFLFLPELKLKWVIELLKWIGILEIFQEKKLMKF